MYRGTVLLSSLLQLTAAAVIVAAVTAADGDLLDRVLDRCSLGPGAVDCLKSNVLEYLDDGREGRARRTPGTDLDAELVTAAGRYIERRVSDDTAARPARAMENGAADAAAQQPTPTTTTTTARADMEMGMMQDKMLMPLMMIMKMKMKMLMPIMMALVSMKATKALILSKVAVILVLGFLVKEFLKKSGGLPGLPLHLPGLPGSEPPSTTAGPPMYGPPQSSGYESSSSWEPTGYSSHSSSDSGHSMAYSSYLPSSSSSGSSASLTASKYS